ncbi:HPr family phosphocarrier protein [Lentibacillus kapialis]
MKENSRKNFTVVDKAGIHTKPATKLVNNTAQFNSET